jgi:hypothetical protein
MSYLNTQVGFPDLDVMKMPYAGGIDIPENEFIAQDANGNGVPLTSMADTGNLATNQTNAHNAFAGLSAARRLTSSASGTLPVDRGAVRYCSCAALGAVAKVGSLVGPAATSPATALNSIANVAAVVPVANPALAIGIVAEQAAVGATQIKCYFPSRLVPNFLPATNGV